MKYYFIIFLTLVFASVSFTSCGKKEKVESENLQPYYLTNEDSLIVVNLITEYMDMVKDGDFEGAANMLSWLDKNNTEEMIPLELTKSRRESAIQTMQLFPVKKYKIEKIVYATHRDNEAAVRVWFGEDGDMTTMWYFKPIRYGVQEWHICLRDTEEGDTRLTTPKH